MTPHISAAKEDIAKIVLMTRDPLRAKYIAEKFLTDYELINNIRMMLAYTGYYGDKKITVMASGMGMPSLSVYTEELFNYYEVDKIIKIGTCSSYKEEIKIGDLVLVEKAFTFSNFAYQRDGIHVDLSKASSFINQKIIEQAYRDNIDIRMGNINTSDVFYNNYLDPRVNDKYCLAVEMELFALFYIANKLNKEAAALLTVSDSLVTEEKLFDIELEKVFDNSILLILNSFK